MLYTFSSRRALRFLDEACPGFCEGSVCFFLCFEGNRYVDISPNCGGYMILSLDIWSYRKFEDTDT